MKIYVCIKQVPDTETKIKINNEANGIDEAGVKWIMNPYDEFAVEEALKLKASTAGSTVTVVSLGPKKRVIDSLRTALAMGADDGLLIDAESYVDGATTALAVSKAIQSEETCDIVFTGMSAMDDNAASFSQQLAEHLNIPHTTVVGKFEAAEGKYTMERIVEGGTKEIVELTGSCVVGATKGLNTPRYASLPGIMKAKKKPVKELSISDMGLSETEKISFTDFKLPPEKPPVKMLEGEIDQQVKELAQLLREEAKVL